MKIIGWVRRSYRNLSRLQTPRISHLQASKSQVPHQRLKHELQLCSRLVMNVALAMATLTLTAMLTSTSKRVLARTMLTQTQFLKILYLQDEAQLKAFSNQVSKNKSVHRSIARQPWLVNFSETKSHSYSSLPNCNPLLILCKMLELLSQTLANVRLKSKFSRPRVKMKICQSIWKSSRSSIANCVRTLSTRARETLLRKLICGSKTTNLLSSYILAEQTHVCQKKFFTPRNKFRISPQQKTCSPAGSNLRNRCRTCTLTW